MSERSSFRQPFGGQRVNSSKIVLKSGRHHFFTNIPLIWDKMRWKKSLLVRSEILGLFINTLTSDDKYSRHDRENFPQQIQMQLSQKLQNFSQLFIAFSKSTSISEYFEKQMSLVA